MWEAVFARTFDQEIEVRVTAFTESVVEEAALAWLESLGWAVKHGLDIAPGELFAERTE